MSVQGTEVENDGKEVLDLSKVVEEFREYQRDDKAELVAVNNAQARYIPVHREHVLQVYYANGVTPESQIPVIEEIRRKIALLAEKAKLAEERQAGREPAIYAKIALVAKHKQQTDAMAVEMRDAEHLIGKFDGMFSRIQAIERELKALAPPHLHDAAKAAETELGIAGQRRREAGESVTQAEAAVRRLERYIESPHQNPLQDRNYKPSTEQARLDLDATKKRLATLRASLVTAEIAADAAELKFNQAKLALVSA